MTLASSPFLASNITVGSRKIQISFSLQTNKSEAELKVAPVSIFEQEARRFFFLFWKRVHYFNKFNNIVNIYVIFSLLFCIYVF